MILYHSTTKKRADKILQNQCLRISALKHYTKEASGRGYSTKGFTYLSNEITFSIYFANCQTITDKSTQLYIFRISIPEIKLLPDEDEIRIQGGKYSNDYVTRLDYSLNEFKSCRIDFDVDIKNYAAEYAIIDLNKVNIEDIVQGVGYNFKMTKERYTFQQKDFIDNLVWNKL